MLTMKRESVLKWDEYFMATAFLSSMRSIDLNRQGGACIVNMDNRIIGIGYCGFPRGLDQVPVSGDESDDPSLYTCHSIMNAILNKNQYDIRGCRIYCTHFPCNECAKMIIQSGMTRVTYSIDCMSHSNHDASRLLFTLAGISVCRFSPGKGSAVVLGASADICQKRAPTLPECVE